MTPCVPWSRLACALVLLLALSCRDAGNAGRPDNWRGTSTTSGDTLKVHTVAGAVLGDLGTIPSESLEIVYAGEGVLQSTVLAAADDMLLIGEGTQIVVVEPSGSIDTLGREGDGPGEFRRIIGLRSNGDTIEALDANANRLTRFPSGGAPTSASADAPGQYSEIRPSGLARCRGATMVTWKSGFVARDRPPDTVAVVWWEPGVPPTPWLRVPDMSWTATGNMFGPRAPYGTRALIASDGACRVAIGDAVSYTVQVHDAATGAVTLLSADEVKVPVTAEARTIPERWRGEFAANAIPGVLDLIGVQEFSDSRNQLDALHVDAHARPWVRVVDSTHRYHPWVMARVADARPPTYRWDVFGTDGRRLAIVHLPSNFTPKAWGGRWVYGIAEDEDGALVVGRLPMPKALQ